MYIDGYNFYYSLRNRSGYPVGLGWCNFKTLGDLILAEPDYVLERIKYFTAPVGDSRHDIGEEQRQNTWLSAVRTIKELQVIPGYYVGSPQNRKEKQTDVNIAVEMVLDAVNDNGYDTALLFSGDMDLAPAIRAVKKLPNHKSVIVCVPTYEPYEGWSKLSRDYDIAIKEITREMLEKSRFPDRIPARPSAVMCPSVWHMPES